MVLPSWSGIFPAALTMFTGRGELDEEATHRHMRSLVSQGVHGLVAAGTSGEFIGLTDEERIRVVEIAVDAASGDVPVIAGTGTYSTQQTIELTRAATNAGASGAIVILPYYQRPSYHEVLEHYREVARATEIPVMLYNNPRNTGAPPLEAEDIATLHDEGVLAAVKSTFPTVHQINEVREATPPSFRVFYGSFMAPLEALAGGADGWISGILNVVSRDAVSLWESMGKGSIDEARDIWRRIAPIKYLYTRQQVGPGVSDLSIYRGILKLRGEASGEPRRPLLPLSSDQMRKLEDRLGQEGLI